MKKLFMLCGCMMYVCVALLAVPAMRNVVSVAQADGTTLQVRLHGDEYFHYVTTADGYLLQKNMAGVYEYGLVDVVSDTARLSGIAAHNVGRRTAAELTDTLSAPARRT